MRIETFWSESVDERGFEAGVDRCCHISGTEDETQLIFQHSMPIEEYRGRDFEGDIPSCTIVGLGSASSGS